MGSAFAVTSGHGVAELVARYDWVQHSGAEGDLQGFFLTPHQPDKIGLDPLACIGFLIVCHAGS